MLIRRSSVSRILRYTQQEKITHLLFSIDIALLADISFNVLNSTRTYIPYTSALFEYSYSSSCLRVQVYEYSYEVKWYNLYYLMHFFLKISFIFINLLQISQISFAIMIKKYASNFLILQRLTYFFTILPFLVNSKVHIYQLGSKTNLQTLVYYWSFCRLSSIKIGQDGYLVIILRQMSQKLYQTSRRGYFHFHFTSRCEEFEIVAL